MNIFFTPDHILHAPELELHRGGFVPAHEGSHRMDMLLSGMRRAGFSEFITPTQHSIERITTVHSPNYIKFVQTAWQRWQDAGYSGDVLPMSYARNSHRPSPPEDIDGAAGYFSSSADTVITQTSWAACKAVADCAISAAESISKSGKSAFTLTRPPGHHAGADYMSGYCILNYAAIAAQALRDNGAERVAILDVDFHHGNGTQDIFYNRDDVFFASLHGHPNHHFPYFWGHADEIGIGNGEGYTANFPLAPETPYAEWSEVLKMAITRIEKFGAEALVVSLGVDTYEHDPISSFKLKQVDYARYGALIAALKLPTVFIMEGGYGVPEIGDNTAGVLTGFMNSYD